MHKGYLDWETRTFITKNSLGIVGGDEDSSIQFNIEGGAYDRQEECIPNWPVNWFQMVQNTGFQCL